MVRMQLIYIYIKNENCFKFQISLEDDVKHVPFIGFIMLDSPEHLKIGDDFSYC